jgi:BirA family biotin operon repressor/biotin-[acetyl-CoA-carboxylase] ligase
MAEVDSTLSEARRIAPDLQQPTWILAHHQTAARGRRGRNWGMPNGNFAATLVLRPQEPVARAALRSFVMALAVGEVVSDLSGAADIALKWPNDVLLDGGKLAGILLESAGDARGLEYLAIGVGVNLCAVPDVSAMEPGAMAPVSLLGQTGLMVSPADFLEALAGRYAALEAQFTEMGFEPIRRAWLNRAARRGQVLRARMMREEVTGVFQDVDPAGNLVLMTDQGRRVIPAADVYF